jgi:hypothetical protein
MQTNPTAFDLALEKLSAKLAAESIGNTPPLGKVDASRGAPMGRTAHGYAQPGCKIVRLFRFALDSGGYDTGGAYWGIGAPMYCATDGVYRTYTRATSRAVAAKLLNLTNAELLRSIN